MPWYFFAAATPTLYSVSVYIDKFLVVHKIRNPLVMTCVSAMVTGCAGAILGCIMGFPYVNPVQFALLVTAGFLLVFYLIPYYEALNLDDASRIIPLYQFIPVFTLILSALVLDETMSPRQTAGIIIVVLAGLYLSAEKITGRMFAPRKSLWFMIVSSLMYGFVTILFRFAARDIGFWTCLAYEFMGTGLGALSLLLVPGVRRDFKPQLRSFRSVWGLLAGNNVIAVLAQMSEAYAVSLAAVPLVNIVSGIQPVVTLALGLVLTRWFPHIVAEDISPSVLIHKFSAIAFILGGLYIVYA